jgi:excisionase family DNA binding protein
MKVELTDIQLNEIASRVATIVIKGLSRQKPSAKMSIREVAEYINMSIVTIRRLIRRPDFPAPMKIGRDFRFDREEIEAWLERKAEEGNEIYRPR